MKIQFENNLGNGFDILTTNAIALLRQFSIDEVVICRRII